MSNTTKSIKQIQTIHTIKTIPQRVEHYVKLAQVQLAEHGFASTVKRNVKSVRITTNDVDRNIHTGEYARLSVLIKII